MPQSCFSRRNPAATLPGRLCWWTAESRRVQRERYQVPEWQAENNRQTQRRSRALFAAMLRSRQLSGFRNWFDASKQKHIASNADQEKDRGRCERSRKGIRCSDNIARNDRRGDSCKVIAKIDDSAEGADALAGSYQRRNRPTHW